MAQASVNKYCFQACHDKPYFNSKQQIALHCNQSLASIVFSSVCLQPWCSEPPGMAERHFVHLMVGNNTGGLCLAKLNPILYEECKGSASVDCAQATCMQSSLTGVQTPKNENRILSPSLGEWCCRNCLFMCIRNECTQQNKQIIKKLFLKKLVMCVFTDIQIFLYTHIYVVAGNSFWRNV